jgi:hypothetical protein
MGQALGQQLAFPVSAQVLVQAFQPTLGIIQLVPGLVQVDPDVGPGWVLASRAQRRRYSALSKYSMASRISTISVRTSASNFPP